MGFRPDLLQFVVDPLPNNMARSITFTVFVVLSLIALVRSQAAQSGQYAFSYTVNQHRLDAGIPSDFESTVNDQYTPEQTQHHLHNQQQQPSQVQQEPQPQFQYNDQAGQQYQANAQQ